MATELKLQRVLDYLTENGGGSKISIRQATKYDNVGDAILKLRHRGHNIITTWAFSSTGAKYAVYCLVKGSK